ncbi:bifunctional folylpolyglutamate synthase/dihydrofolate synthase [Anaerobranca gottschalkii]|uniref:tetrahydrofolate synthase n=1 Tax=Anaerobranca gottschalkii DSM 13577 TaxID=1120990 RepID=A0A1H9YA01_9FIRM|nr:folylpolyglutamate synthase/dihydrofolate synthase family protein [Anaerobranca gottschalkii]SES65212.1 dihydrofolate synthase / folylpolyglutamate synthase [Anaerobranca gottschalkii DSM 13577]
MKMLNLIQSLGKFGMNSEGCKRMQLLCEMLGNPQSNLKFIHVGGTNGKGSTCHMLASILQKQGYKVGVYISPALYKFNERITINGQEISDEDLNKYYPLFKETLKHFHNHPLGYPTEFEVVTALAFLYFKEQKVDYVVLEVGLGGRFDATNVVIPILSIITNIDLDHTEILGDTVEQIAFEKAGIIKEGIPLCLGIMDEKAKNVIAAIAKGKNAQINLAEEVEIQLLDDTVEGQVFLFEGEKFILSLLGKHQINNLKIVLKAIQILRELNIPIYTNSVKEGLRNTKWPGRFEIITLEGKKIILDVAHNPNSMEALKDNLLNYFPKDHITMVLGIFKDKDISSMLRHLKSLKVKLYLTKPIGDRGMDATELEKIVKKFDLEIIGKNNDLLVAFNEAFKVTNKIICVCGSFNTVGPIRNYLFRKELD